MDALHRDAPALYETAQVAAGNDDATGETAVEPLGETDQLDAKRIPPGLVGIDTIVDPAVTDGVLPGEVADNLEDGRSKGAAGGGGGGELQTIDVDDVGEERGEPGPDEDQGEAQRHR